MTFGRWLLINSFNISIVSLIAIGYIYREELQLGEAVDQLLLIEPTTITAEQTDKAISKVAIANDQKKTDIEIEKPSKQNITPDQDINIVPTVKLSQQVSTSSNTLETARKLYWKKDFYGAIKGYESLIEGNPDNPDLLGELGNIYYAVNDTQNASRFYYKAALLLIDQQQKSRAYNLLAPISAMDRDLGARLNQRLGAVN